MMRKYMIVVNTYYQLITAIQMKLTLLKGSYIVLVISNHSRNADTISLRLREQHIFNEIIYLESKGVREKRNYIQRIGDIVRIANYRNNRFAEFLDLYPTIKSQCFDEIICYNMELDIYGLYVELSRSNSNLRISVLEEGPLSYNFCLKLSRGQRIIDFLWKLMRRRTIEDIVEDFYCFYPDYYTGRLKIKKIPKISTDSECTAILRNVFNIDKNKLDYRQKYIFFTSIYDFEGDKPIGEYELVSKVAELVGKENLLVKTHPRDPRDIYEKNGFIVDDNSNVPWEVIQLSGDFSNNIFIATSSSSVLAGSFMSEYPIKTFYMFKLCNMKKNSLAIKSENAIKELLSNEEARGILDSVYVVERLEDILL